MSYAAFQRYMEGQGIEVSVREDLVWRMKQLIVRSIFATKSLIDPNKRKGCFELFGYDFILDEDMNIWLIEVNTNPCIEESSNLLKIYLPRMIDDMLKLSVDAMFSDFPAKGTPDPAYTFPVEGYSD